jgi:hypothetical protein
MPERAILWTAGPANVDEHYPTYRTDTEASIGEVGFDVYTSKVFDPHVYHDVMSYCPPKWVSPYTYEKLYNHFGLSASRLQRAPRNRATDDAIELSFRAVGGSVQNVSLAPARITRSANAGPVVSFIVETLDKEGTVLDIQYARSEGPYHTAEVLEFDATATLPIGAESHSVRVLHREEVVWETTLSPARSASSLRIAVDNVEDESLTVTADGFDDDETARLDYSWTSGQTWRTVAERVSAGRSVLDTSKLPGGEDCRLRLVVTQGVRQRRKSSDSFAVRLKPIRAMIMAPEDGITVTCDDTVELIGSAVGLTSESGLETMNWASSVDGYLGSGSNLPVQGLSTGRHRITLMVDDGVNGESSRHVFINVVLEDADL